MRRHETDHEWRAVPATGGAYEPRLTWRWVAFCKQCPWTKQFDDVADAAVAARDHAREER